MYLETDLRIMPPSHWKQTKMLMEHLSSAVLQKLLFVFSASCGVSCLLWHRCRAMGAFHFHKTELKSHCKCILKVYGISQPSGIEFLIGHLYCKVLYFVPGTWLHALSVPCPSSSLCPHIT